MPDTPRCTAYLPHKQRRCLNPPLPGTRHCALHTLDRPATSGNSRCTARRLDGAPCQKWAIPGSQPPICPKHSPAAVPPFRDQRRCRARTKTGTRCRNWATVAASSVSNSSGGCHGLCRVHAAGPSHPSVGEPRRCTATTARGLPCRNWAVRATTRPDGVFSTCQLSSSPAPPPLCAYHNGSAGGRRPRPADYDAGRVCSATTVEGSRCARWALAHTDPPLCSFHAYPCAHPGLRHGYYRRLPALNPLERAYVLALAATDTPLAAELLLLRLKIRALLAYTLRPGLSSADQLAAYRCLLQAQRELLQAREPGSGGSAAPLANIGPWTGGGLGVTLSLLNRADARVEPRSEARAEPRSEPGTIDENPNEPR